MKGSSVLAKYFPNILGIILTIYESNFSLRLRSFTFSVQDVSKDLCVKDAI